MSASHTASIVLGPGSALRRIDFMNHESDLRVGQNLRSKRTGRLLTITALDDDRVYYTVEGFKTIAPLFLKRDKFLHLVGGENISENNAE